MIPSIVFESTAPNPATQYAIAPPKNKDFLPNRSERGPATNCPTAIESNRVVKTSCAMFESALRSIAIAGMAGATKVTANGASPAPSDSTQIGGDH